jgi:hypothetical protein
MVSRRLVDSETELAELSRHFVCLKFCERDDAERYYRAAGYFLPQWYWQPMVAYCFPDGGEIDLAWRHTHESVPVARLAHIMRLALKQTGEGIDADLARGLRAKVEKAFEALDEEEHAQALALAVEVRQKVDKGWIADEADEDDDTLLNALNLAIIRSYAEAFELLQELKAKTGPASDAAREILPPLRKVLSQSLGLSRVALGRYRFGPDIYHDIRAELRSRLSSVEKLVLQYSVLLNDGTVYAAFEEHSPVEGGNHLRSSVLLPYLEAGEASNIADIRVEIWIGDHLLDARHLHGPQGGDPWWEKKTVKPLVLDTHRSSTWNGAGFEKTKNTGTSVRPNRKVETPDRTVSAVHARLRKIYEILDNRRFTHSAVAARYRLMALGRRSLPFVLPLAYRYGAMTTIQLLPVLARSPDGQSAAMLLHNLGADDVTIRFSAFRQLDWIAGQPDVDLAQTISYLSSTDERLRTLAIRSLGLVGKKEAFLPLLGHFRTQKPGSREAELAVQAMAMIAGRDFGLDSKEPLREQEKAVRRVHAWWTTHGKDGNRALWMAYALQEMRIAPKGVLSKALVKADRHTLAHYVRLALSSGKDLGIRCGLLLAKDQKLTRVGPDVLALFGSIDGRSQNSGLSRNVLRELMTLELLGEVIGMLARPGKRSTVLDLLLVVTRQNDFYPAHGMRMTGKAWTSEHVRWASWFKTNRDKLRWDEKEMAFVREE